VNERDALRTLRDPAAEHDPGVDIGEGRPAPAPTPLAPAPGEPMPRIFFVTGAQKSGTTWVARTLARHPCVHCFGESVLFGLDSSPGEPWAWIDRARMEAWMCRPYSSRMNEHGIHALERAARRGMVEAMLRLHMRPGILAMGERTPHFHILAIERIHELFPEAAIVEVVRDGRDVAVSYAFHMLRHGLTDVLWSDPDMGRRAEAFHIRGEGEPAPLLTPEGVRDCATRWRLAIEAGERARRLFDGRHVRLCYETLLNDPRQIAQAFGVLDVEANDTQLDACVRAESFEAITGRGRGEADPTSFHRKGVAGDWRAHFTPELEAVYMDIAGQAMARAGYPVRVA
jgi:hypothetical protein